MASKGTVELVIRAKDESLGLLKQIAVALQAIDSVAAQIDGGQGVAKIGKDAKGTAVELDKVEKEARESGKAVEDLNKKNLKNVRKEATRTEKAFGKLDTQTRGIITTFAAGFGIARIIQEVREFSRAVAEVSTLVDESVRSSAELRADVLQVADTFGVDAAETARALYDVISSGAEAGAEANNVLAEATKLAIGGVTTVGSATTALTSILNAYNLETSQAADVNDVLFTTVKNGITTIEQLGSSIFQVAPIAASTGVALEEVGAALAAITSQGVPTAQAATQLRSAIVGLTTSKDSAAALRDLGFASAEAAIEQLGFAETLRQVVSTTDGTNAELQKLFGRIEGVNAALALTGSGADTFNKTLGDIENGANATDEAVRKVQESVGGQLDQAINKANNSLLKFEDVVKTIAIDILPVFVSALEKVGSVIEANSNFVGKLVVALTGLVALRLGTKVLGWVVPLEALKASLLGTAAAGAAANTSMTAMIATGAKLAVVIAPFAALFGAGLFAVNGFAEGLDNLAESVDELNNAKLDEALATTNLESRIQFIRENFEQFKDAVTLSRDELRSLSQEELEQYIQQMDGARQITNLLTLEQERLGNSDAAEILRQQAADYEQQLILARTRQVELNQELENARIDAENGSLYRFLSEDARQLIGQIKEAKEEGRSFGTVFAAALKQAKDELNNFDLNALDSALQSLAQQGEASAKDLRASFREALQDIGDEDFELLLQAADKAKERMGAAGFGAGEVYRENLRRSLEGVGVDLAAIEAGISSSVNAVVESLEGISEGFANSNLTTKQQAESLEEIIADLSFNSVKELDAVRSALSNLFPPEVVSQVLGQLNKVRGELIKGNKDVTTSEEDLQNEVQETTKEVQENTAATEKNTVSREGNGQANFEIMQGLIDLRKEYAKMGEAAAAAFDLTLERSVTVGESVARFIERFAENLRELDAEITRQQNTVTQALDDYGELGLAARDQLELAINSAKLLGEEELEPLRAALDDANQKLAQMRDQAIDTANQIEVRLARALGQDVRAQELTQANELATLEAQIEQARKAGADLETINALEEARANLLQAQQLELQETIARQEESNLQLGESIDLQTQLNQAAAQQNQPEISTAGGQSLDFSELERVAEQVQASIDDQNEYREAENQATLDNIEVQEQQASTRRTAIINREAGGIQNSRGSILDLFARETSVFEEESRKRVAQARREAAEISTILSGNETGGGIASLRGNLANLITEAERVGNVFSTFDFGGLTRGALQTAATSDLSRVAVSPIARPEDVRPIETNIEINVDGKDLLSEEQIRAEILPRIETIARRTNRTIGGR